MSEPFFDNRVRMVEFRNGYRYDALESVLSVGLIFLTFIESAFDKSG